MLAAGHVVQAVGYAGGTVLAAVVASHVVRTRVLQATGQ
jgi:hypothetical protein